MEAADKLYKQNNGIKLPENKKKSKKRFDKWQVVWYIESHNQLHTMDEISIDELQIENDLAPADADELAEDEGMEGLTESLPDIPEKSESFLVEMPENERQAAREKFFAEMGLDPDMGAKRGFSEILAGAPDMRDFH